MRTSFSSRGILYSALTGAFIMAAAIWDVGWLTPLIDPILSCYLAFSDVDWSLSATVGLLVATFYATVVFAILVLGLFMAGKSFSKSAMVSVYKTVAMYLSLNRLFLPMRRPLLKVGWNFKILETFNKNSALALGDFVTAIFKVGWTKAPSHI